MSEFLPRTEPIAAVKSATERGPAPTVQRESAAPLSARESPAGPVETERSAATASYSRIKARIASALADLNPPRAPVATAVGTADRAISALLPEPIIVIPMPPTDPDMIAFVAQVAQSVAERTVQARASHANLRPVAVESALM